MFMNIMWNKKIDLYLNEAKSIFQISPDVSYYSEEFLFCSSPRTFDKTNKIYRWNVE